MSEKNMESNPATAQHKLIGLLSEVRFTLSSACAALQDDRVIARPLQNMPISQTNFWDDALTSGKKLGSQLLTQAHSRTTSAYVLAGDRSKSELGAIVFSIKENVEWALRCLHMNGDAPNNDDRIAAFCACEIASTLSSAAVRVFFAQCLPLSASSHFARGSLQKPLPTADCEMGAEGEP